MYNKHWTKSRDQISADYQPAQSDAMQLYSIGAGQLIMVQNTGQSWDHDYELSAIRKKGNSRKRKSVISYIFLFIYLVAFVVMIWYTLIYIICLPACLPACLSACPSACLFACMLACMHVCMHGFFSHHPREFY